MIIPPGTGLVIIGVILSATITVVVMSRRDDNNPLSTVAVVYDSCFIYCWFQRR